MAAPLRKNHKNENKKETVKVMSVAAKTPFNLTTEEQKLPKPILISEADNLKSNLEEQYTEEVVFALCGPIGSPIHEVATRLRTILLSKYQYDECIIISLGKEIPYLGQKIKGSIAINSNDRHKELVSKIDVANKLRKKFGHGFLAEHAINLIYKHRISDPLEEVGDLDKILEKEMVIINNQPIPKEIEEKKVKKKRRAYIIDSIKNLEELEILKLVYRDLLYFIGVFAPLKDRIHYLKKELNDEKGLLIGNLINIDSGEENAKHINVKDTFPKADFFIRIHGQNYSQIDKKLERFLNLIFDLKIIVPTQKETAMYLAASSAKNSACLSRQVGAALTDEKEEIISVGWNDVPKFGGDLYKSSLSDYEAMNNSDQRCMYIESGFCFNDAEKTIVANLIYEELNEKKLLVQGNSANMKQILAQFSDEDKSKLTNIELITKYVLSKSRIRSLLEFSRSIHAEMHAIIIGSQTAGNRVRGGRLFITTYPCHNCARHIIVAGIKYVYYIEPYSKSLTTKLHFDSITEDESDENKVRILLFEGVGPNRFLELFEMSKQRKQSGTGKMDIKSKLIGFKPKTTIPLQSVTAMEKMVVEHYIKH